MRAGLAILSLLLAAPLASAAPPPSTCVAVGGLQGLGFCEVECAGSEGNARSTLNVLLVYFRGTAPCDGSEGSTYGHVILVAAGAAYATGDYGQGRQTAVLVFAAGVGILVDWHEYGGACTTTAGVYDAHGWPYFAHNAGCPFGNAPTSPDPGYGDLLP